MSLARILSRTQIGLEAPLVQVELHLGRGLPAFCIVGLPAPVVRESRERVRAALLNSGYSFPNSRITVNLAPVELSKHGGRFDLPIALGLLIASGQLAAPSRSFECYGELGLSGELKGVSGLFLAALRAQGAGHAILVPADNGLEVARSGHCAAYAAASLAQAARQLHADRDDALPAVIPQSTDPAGIPLLADVAGHWQAKRALTVAAAGGHSLLMIGPPGSGKSMLAARMPGLLPPLDAAQALEVAAINSVAGAPTAPRGWHMPPFRAPHHTASAHAIVGGGPRIRPGEITLAHHGVLFLDELPEFDRRVLESLREPLETGSISIARAAGRLELPAQFQLLAAMNPCPCGYFGDPRDICRCGRGRIERYRMRISGPLMDRIDLRIEVPCVPREELLGAALAPLSRAAPEPAALQALRARRRRLERSGVMSARLSVAQLQTCCELSGEADRLLRRGCQQFGFSARAAHRLLAVSRTVADLDDSERIEASHLAEAIALRRGARRYFASETM